MTEWPGTPVGGAQPAPQWPGTPMQRPPHEPEGPADNPDFRREYELYRKTGGQASSQTLKGVPVIGGLAQKGVARLNAAIAGVPYETELGAMRAADEAYEREHPVASTALQVGGGAMATTGLAGGAPGALTLGPRATVIPPTGPSFNLPRAVGASPVSQGSSVARSALGGGGTTLGGRVALSAGSGATLGSLDAATRDQDQWAGGALGGAVGAAGPVVGRVVGAAANQWRGTTARSAAPTEQALRAAGDADFNAARNTHFVMPGQDLVALSAQIEQQLQNRLTHMQAPETFDILRRMQMAPHGSAVDPNSLLTIREQLVNAASNHQNPREALAAGHAIEQLDNYLSNQPSQFSDLYASGRGNWGAAKRSERFSQDVLENASRNADVAHAGENLGNSTRQRLNAYIKSNQRGTELGRGANDAEIAAADKVARGTGFANAARKVQSYTGGLKRGSIASVAGGYIGSHFGPWGIPVGMAVPHAISDIARRAAEASTVRGARNIDEMLRLRSPLGAQANAARAQANATNQTSMRRGALTSRAVETPIAQMLQDQYTEQPRERLHVEVNARR